MPVGLEEGGCVEVAAAQASNFGGASICTLCTFFVAYTAVNDADSPSTM